MIKKPRFLSLILICTVILSLIPIPPVSAEIPDLTIKPLSSNQAQSSAPEEVLVKFLPSIPAEEAEAAHRSIGAQKIGEIKDLKVHLVKLPRRLSIDNAIARYQKMAQVSYAEPNHYRHALVTPNDSDYAKQWALPKIGAPEAWDITTGGDVTVAVLDTGVDYSHPDLVRKVIKGYDFVNNDSDPMDDAWHGTHVAGTVAATANNGQGVAGVSWGAKVLAVKVLDKDGSGTNSMVANGIIYAADSGAKIINLSLGGTGYSQVLADAILYAQNKGCVVVAAAGNDSTDTVDYPAGYQNVIGVSATDSSDSKASYTNYGWYVDIAAPGVNIYSCYPGSRYVWATGTSMAAPHVSGLAALMLSRYPTRSSNQLVRTLQETVDDLGVAGDDIYFGYGRINAKKAVSTNFVCEEETNADTTYSGSWKSTASSYASSGGYKASSTVGSSASYSFYGTGVTWVGKRSSSSGIAKVYIDGVYQKDVDLYGQTDYQQLLFTKTGLPLGMHTIAVEVKGAKNINSSGYEVNVDAFDVAALEDSAPPAVALPPPEDSNDLPASTTPIAIDLAPSAPQGLRLVSNNGTILLGWSPNTEEDLAGYTIYRKETSEGTIKLNSTLLANVQYQDISAKPGMVYTYYITAVDNAGNESQKSVELEAAIAIVKAEVVFSDISSNAWYRNTVYSLVSRGVIGGYPDGTFRPTNPVTRAEFAKMVCLAMGWTLADPATASFKDVPKSHWAYRYIETAKAHSAIGGYPDGSLAPGNNITRAEIAKIVAKTLNLPTGTSTLKDLGTHWAKEYINSCVGAGIVGGYPDGTFKPDSTATRAESSKMIAGMVDGG